MKRLAASIANRSSLPEQVRIVARPAGQADRDAGAEVRRREGEKRGADDSASVQEIHAAEEIRGDHGDGQGRETSQQEAAGNDGESRQRERAREDGVPQPDLHTAASNGEQADADQEHVTEGEEARGELAVADTEEPERQMRGAGRWSSARQPQRAPKWQAHALTGAKSLQQTPTVTAEPVLGV